MGRLDLQIRLYLLPYISKFPQIWEEEISEGVSNRSFTLIAKKIQFIALDAHFFKS